MTNTTQAFVVVLLILTGAMLWTAGGHQREVAGVERSLAGLLYEQAAAEAAAVRSRTWMPAPGGLLSSAPSSIEATAAYWQGNDGALGEGQALLAANAAFRQVRQEGGSWQHVVTRLDEVIARYAAILQDEPGNVDAAYNYELAVRQRNTAARLGQPVDPAGLEGGAVTLHGVPGAPPHGTDMKQFKIIIPMTPEERMEAEEAGRGETRIRKG